MNKIWRSVQISLNGMLLIFVAIVLYRLDYVTLESLAHKSRWHWLALLVGLIFIQNELSVLKWYRILKIHGVKLPLSKIRASFWASLISGLLLPSAILGDIHRFCYLRPLLGERKNAGKDLLKSQFVDRLSIYFSFLFFVFISAPFYLFNKDYRDYHVQILMAFFILLILSGVFIKQLLPQLENKYEFLLSLKKIDLFVYSLLITVTIPLKLFLAMMALGLNVNFTKYMLLSPIILGAYLVPIGGSAFGTRELVMYLFASQLSLNSSQALGASFLVGFCISVSSVLGSCIFFFDYKSAQRFIKKLAEPAKHASLILTTFAVLVGLHPACLYLCAILYLGLVMWRVPKFGFLNPANVATFLRLSILIIFILPNLAAYHKGMILILLLVLDGIDGFLARKLSCETAFGAKFDMEVDALTVLFASWSLVAYQDFPVWVLCLGLWRYAFACWRAIHYTSCSVDRRSKLGRWIFVFTMLSLCCAFLLPPQNSVYILLIAFLALSISFSQDIVFIIRKARNHG